MNEQNVTSSTSAESAATNQAEAPDPKVRTPKTKPRPALWAIPIGVCALAYIGIAPRVSQSRELSSEVATLKAESPTVEVVALLASQADADISLPGNIQAIDETTLNARTNGYLKARFVDIGSKVKKGDVLAVVDSPEMDQQLGQAVAEVAKSRAGVSQAQAEVSKGDAGIAASKAAVAQYVASEEQDRAELTGLLAQQQRAKSAIAVAISLRDEAQARVDAARANSARAQSALNIADKTLRRWKALFKVDAVPGQEVDEKQADFDSATASLSAAKADVSTALATLQAATQTIESAQSELMSAKANVESGRQRLSSAGAMVEAARAQVQASYATVQAGSSGVTSATALVLANQANAMRYQTLQGFEHIVAPFSGVITSRNVDEGDLVGPPNSSATGGSSDQMVTAPRTGLFGLAKTDQLRIQLEVPQAFMAQIHRGQLADVLVPELTQKPFHGYVFRVAGALDSQSRTLLVEVRVENPSGALKPGTYAKVHFKSLRQAGIDIPANTLIFDAQGTRVAELGDDNRVHFQTVEVGRDLGSQLEIVSGLTGHERLIANPATTLTEGENVNPLESAKK